MAYWLVAWEVEFTEEWGAWWETLTELGPALGFPYSSKVNAARYEHMRELRVQSGGRPLRTLYAFNPLRTAILLLGGDKTGDDRWYRKFVPIADRLYAQHLDELRNEGKL